MSATVPNPLRDAYAACLALVQSKSDFLAAFTAKQGPAPKGIVSLDPHYGESYNQYFSPNPDLPFAAPNDYPRIRLWYAGGRPLTERDSSSSELEMTLRWQVNTGAQCQALLLDIQWAIYRSLLGWRSYVKDTVLWQGKACVYDVDAESIRIQEDMAEDQSPSGERADWQLPRGVDQWWDVWGSVLRFYFTSADLQDN